MPFINSNIYCLELSFCTDHGLSPEYLWKKTSEYNSGKTKQYANHPNPDYPHASKSKVLIEYDSLPIKQLEKIKLSIAVEDGIKNDFDLKEHLIARETAKQVGKLYIQYIESNKDLYAEVYQFFLKDPRSYEKANELRNEAFWLMMLAPAKNKKVKSLGYQSVDQLYKDSMCKMREDIPHFKCKNLRYFKDRLSPFKKAFNEVWTIDSLLTPLEDLKPKLAEKTNAAKLRGSDLTPQMQEMQAELIRLYGDPMKLTIQQTWLSYTRTAHLRHLEYNQSDGLKGWNNKCFIGPDAIRDFLFTPRIKQVWYAKRNGQKIADDIYDKTTKRRAASYANQKWVIDGTPWHRYFMDGNKAWQRINVFVVLDAHSWCVIGFFISTSENTDQVLGALRSACLMTGYVPNEIQMDNSSPIQSWHVQNAIEKIESMGIPTRPGNAKSKKIEAFFGHFNDKVGKFRKGYTGNPFAKLDRQANREHLMDLIRNKELADWDQAVKDLHEDFGRWNNMLFNQAKPLEKYKESLAKSQNAQKKFTPEMDVEAFWYTPGEMKQIKDTSSNKRKTKSVFIPTEYTFTNSGISIKRKNHFGEKYKIDLDTDNPEFNSQHIGDKFTLKINPVMYELNESLTPVKHTDSQFFEPCALLYKNGKPFHFNGEHFKLVEPHAFAEAKGDMAIGEPKKLTDHLETKKTQKQLVKKELSRFERISGTKGITHEDVYGKVHLTELQTGFNESINEGNNHALEAKNEEVFIENEEQEETVKVKSRFDRF